MNKLQVTKHIIAYFDILGYKENIRKNQDEFFGSIQYFIEEFLLKQVNILKNEFLNDLQYRVFSDNFIFALPIDSNALETAKKIHAMEKLISFIEFSIIYRYYWFIRGCIHIGDLFINQNFVFGKGLVEAYKYENEIAIFPRIIITSAVVNEIKNIDFPQLTLYQLQQIYDSRLRTIYNDDFREYISNQLLFYDRLIINESDFNKCLIDIMPNKQLNDLQKIMLPCINKEIHKLVFSKLIKDKKSIYYLDFLNYEKINKEEVIEVYKKVCLNCKNITNENIKRKYNWLLKYMEKYVLRKYI